ncbi:hypothetical protein [Oribacterium sp. P6A1]|uniref:hypothetical protein n=1 Tax=Oribacterium sp. P6A1 TaxID=1410612 RepID=UPI00055AACC3|nr:hypothetical protein [Oribacterium sp. P6A1]
MILGTDNNFYFVCQDYLSEEKPPMYSDDDLYCLAHIINAEMGCESWEDKIYTGSVVLNRVHGDLWWSNGQRTIRAVVFRTKMTRAAESPVILQTVTRIPVQETQEVMVTALPVILKQDQTMKMMRTEMFPVDQAIHQAIMKKLQKIHLETINQTMKMMLIPVIKRIQIPKMKIQIRIIQIPIQT